MKTLISPGIGTSDTERVTHLRTNIKNAARYVYYFGGGKADGNESMKNLLGGKGANLAEMAGHPNLRLPVPRDLQLQQKCVLTITTIKRNIRLFLRRRFKKH